MRLVTRQACLSALLLFFLVFVILSSCSVAQENAIRVGVAVMQNQADRSVPGNLERDRLAQALNRMKPDKKTHLQVQGVPLGAATANEADEEAAAKKCAYVVYTTLIELRNADDPYQRVPGTIETNPNSQWSQPNNPRGQQQDPEYRVTVDYKLYQVGGSAVGGSPYSTQLAMNEIDAVSQVMDRIASRVADEVKKAAPPAAKE
ncbi:MAG: hypothetical protein WBS19_07275 [Candidatus Korobacteraceae bacterium]